MRARRAGTAAARVASTSIEKKHGAPPLARRGRAQLYRALPRAQPGPERSGGTRPNHAVRRLSFRIDDERAAPGHGSGSSAFRTNRDRRLASGGGRGGGLALRGAAGDGEVPRDADREDG